MPATRAASVTSLVKTIVGAGILGVPFALAQTGLLLGLVLLLFAGAAQLFALQLLTAVIVESRARGSSPSFRTFAVEAFGSHVGATVIEAINGIHCFGTATAYLLVVGDLAPQLAGYLGGCAAHDELSCPWLTSRRVWISVVGLAIELPLFWQRTLDALKMTSAIGNAAVGLVGVLTAAFATGVLHTASPPTGPPDLLPPPPERAPLATRVGVLGVYVFAFACAMNLAQLSLELEQPTARRIGTVLVWGVGLSSLLYCLVGISGAVAFGADVAPNLLLSFPMDPAAGLWATASGFAARLAMVSTVACTFPVLMHPARNSAALVCLGTPAARLSAPAWAALSLGLFGGRYVHGMLEHAPRARMHSVHPLMCTAASAAAWASRCSSPRSTSPSASSVAPAGCSSASSSPRSSTSACGNGRAPTMRPPAILTSPPPSTSAALRPRAS